MIRDSECHKRTKDCYAYVKNDNQQKWNEFTRYSYTVAIWATAQFLAWSKKKKKNKRKKKRTNNKTKCTINDRYVDVFVGACIESKTRAHALDIPIWWKMNEWMNAAKEWKRTKQQQIFKEYYFYKICIHYTHTHKYICIYIYMFFFYIYINIINNFMHWLLCRF